MHSEKQATPVTMTGVVSCLTYTFAQFPVTVTLVPVTGIFLNG
jgi:hypothetical protein